MPIFGAKSRAMRGCASKLACGHRIRPAEGAVFTVIFGEFRTSYWADRVVGPYGGAFISRYLCRGGRLCPPADRTVFMKIFGKFVTSQRADVGIGPYKAFRQIRTALQILNAKRFYRSHLNVTVRKSVVP